MLVHAYKRILLHKTVTINQIFKSFRRGKTIMNNSLEKLVKYRIQFLISILQNEINAPNKKIYFNDQIIFESYPLPVSMMEYTSVVAEALKYSSIYI